MDSEDFRDYWNKRGKASQESGSQPTAETPDHGRAITLNQSLTEFYEARFRDMVSLSSDEIVLDLGCGSGEFIESNHKNAKFLCGLDFSQEMIKGAAFRLAAVSNAGILVGDARRLPFQSGIFDKVVSISMFQYLNNQDCRNVIEEIVRVLKPGGYLVVHVKNGFSLRALSIRALRLLGLLREEPGWYRPFYRYRHIFDHLGQIVDELSYDIAPLGYPVWLYRLTRGLEFKLGTFRRLVQPFGTEYFFKIKLK